MNSEFKSVIHNDLMQTFFNTDEFCDYHTINGKKMRVLFDNYELAKRDPSGAKDSDGIYTKTLFILVPVNEYGARPKVNSTIILDEKYNYSIEMVDEEDGMYALTLEAFRV